MSGLPMSLGSRGAPTLTVLDDATRELVRLAAVVAAGDEGALRAGLDAARQVPSEWVEELILQSYLFAGFPRALNAMREWRRISGHPAPETAGDEGTPEHWRVAGEVTCERVYGGTYRRLRHNIRRLHPQLDEWMIVEGYGKVLSRPGLDLPRRELCIVAACTAAEQDRQLHSHLHGALNAGAAPEVVSAALDALVPVVGAAQVTHVRMLWARVLGK